MPENVDKSNEYEAACFVGETYVIVEGGERLEIQFVGEGTKVLSRCENTGEIGYKKVLTCFLHERIPTYYLFYDQNNETQLPIDTTAEHPFWVKGKGWTEVINLQPGDVFETFDGVEASVKYVKSTGYRADVYNLEIEDFHTYFVGYEGLWAHNTKRCLSKPA